MATPKAGTPKSKAVPKTALTPKVARAPVAAPSSRTGRPKSQTTSPPGLNAQERDRLIAQAAYFRAEKRGFAPGYELQDWVEAEAEVKQLIGGR
jgi:Protein of unknown function (DUF2934)